MKKLDDLKKYKLIVGIFTILTFLLVLYVNLVPLGIADGGGYYKTVENLGLSYTNPPSNDYFSTEYGVTEGETTVDTAFSAVVKTAIIFMGDFMSTRALGILFSIILLIGLWLFLYAPYSKEIPYSNYVHAIFGFLVFADVSYMLYFNTLYSQGLIFVSLLMFVALILLGYQKEKMPYWLTATATVFALLFALNGYVTACCGVILGVILIRSIVFQSDKKHKIVSATAGVVVAALSLSFIFAYESPSYKSDVYNSVFFGVAKYDNVEKLGLNGELNKYKEQFLTQSTEKAIESSFYNNISYGKIMKYYITHPQNYFKLASDGAKNSTIMRIPYLGNFTEKTDKKVLGLSINSRIKEKFVPNNIMTIIILFLGIMIFAILNYKKYGKKQSFIMELMMYAVFAMVIAFKLPLILSGTFEISRELFVYNLLFDFVAIGVITGGVRVMAIRNKKLKEKFGATQ